MKRLFYILTLLTLSNTSIGQTYEVIEMSLEAQPRELQGVNSKYSDFSPFVYQDQLFFTSMREYDLYHVGENNWSNTGFLNVFVSELKGEITAETKIKTASLFSEKLLSNSHTGPVCFSATGDTMFYTQVVINPKKHRKDKAKPQLFMRTKKDKKWGQPTYMSFCDQKHSFGHPFYDSKNRKLYFASDRKGGKGGKDIYYSEIKDGIWSLPKNVEEVNTPSNEMFPFIADGIMFFSSDGAGSKGGLDIFWKVMGQTDEAKPLNGINTEYDDFGIYVFDDMAKGYFSSNRNQKTGDDIYFFYLEKQSIVKNELAGNFTYRNLEGNASNLQVKITNDEGFELITSTDENGNFIFRNLESGGHYKIEPITDEDMNLVLYDKNGEVMATLLNDENGEFTYRLLEKEGVGTLSLIPDDMQNFSLNTGHLSGQFIHDNDPGKYPVGLPVILKDENGNVAYETTTDKRGNFDFRELSLSTNYQLSTKGGDDDLVLLIYDKKGNVTAQLKPDTEGDFVYRKLDPNLGNSLDLIASGNDQFELQSKTISGYFEYKNLEGDYSKGLKVQAFSEDGFLLAETTTDEKGEFRFRSLPVGDNILFKVEDGNSEFQLEDFTLYIFDRQGKKIAVLHRGQNGYFIYKPLGFEGNSSLSTVDTNPNDFTLNINTKYDIVTVYFNSNESAVKSGDRKKLNQLIETLKKNPKLKVDVNAYADSRASDEYNLILSEKRGNWIVDYMVRKGIDKKRCIVNAYGESQLIDTDNHDLNRRAEIRLYE